MRWEGATDVEECRPAGDGAFFLLWKEEHRRSVQCTVYYRRWREEKGPREGRGSDGRDSKVARDARASALETARARRLKSASQRGQEARARSTDQSLGREKNQRGSRSRAAAATTALLPSRTRARHARDNPEAFSRVPPPHPQDHTQQTISSLLLFPRARRHFPREESGRPGGASGRRMGRRRRLVVAQSSVENGSCGGASEPMTATARSGTL